MAVYCAFTTAGVHAWLFPKINPKNIKIALSLNSQQTTRGHSVALAVSSSVNTQDVEHFYLYFIQ